MKINKLSSMFLKSMVKDFSETGKDFFYYEYFISITPDEKEHFIIKALYKLQSDNFVKILDADNIPYETFLLINGIVEIQENTFIKKGYSYFKEIMDLIK